MNIDITDLLKAAEPGIEKYYQVREFIRDSNRTKDELVPMLTDPREFVRIEAMEHLLKRFPSTDVFDNLRVFVLTPENQKSGSLYWSLSEYVLMRLCEVGTEESIAVAKQAWAQVPEEVKARFRSLTRSKPEMASTLEA